MRRDIAARVGFGGDISVRIITKLRARHWQARANDRGAPASAVDAVTGGIAARIAFAQKFAPGGRRYAHAAQFWLRCSEFLVQRIVSKRTLMAVSIIAGQDIAVRIIALCADVADACGRAK